MECGSPIRQMAVLRFNHKRKHGPPASRADLGERCGVRALIVCGLVRTLAGVPGRSGRNEKGNLFFCCRMPCRSGGAFRTDPEQIRITFLFFCRAGSCAGGVLIFSPFSAPYACPIPHGSDTRACIYCVRVRFGSVPFPPC